MKHFCLVMLALILLLGAFSFANGEENKINYSSGKYLYNINDDGTAVIVGYTGWDLSLVIPDRLKGHPVVSIGEEAFSDRDTLTVVTIPDSITSIDHAAFSDCDNLTAITIPDSVTSIGENPFSCCDHLTSIVVSSTHPCLTAVDGVLFDKNEKELLCYPVSFSSPSYEIPMGTLGIGAAAFRDCDELTAITIPDSVTTIGDEAFLSCNSITAITIPNSVTSIGDRAFSGCKLSSITIPESVTVIGGNPFTSCKQLTSIAVSSANPCFITIDGVLFNVNEKLLVCYPRSFTADSYEIPEGTLDIGKNAFLYCNNLTSITLPEGITSIGEGAFSHCVKISI